MPSPPVARRAPPALARRVQLLTLAVVAVLAAALPAHAAAPDKHLDEVLFTLRKRDARVSERFAAAEELVQLKGVKCAGELLDVATEVTTPYALQTLLAELLRGLDADKTQGALRKLVRDERADVQLRLFALRSLRAPADAREARPLLELFESEDALLRREAVRTAVRMDLELAVPALEKLLAKTKKEDELRPAAGLWLDGLAGLTGDEPGLVDRLFDHADGPLRSTRVAAVRLLAERACPGEDSKGVDADAGDPEPTGRLMQALGDPRRIAPRAVFDAELAAQLHEDPRTLALLEASLAAEHWQERHAGVALARSLPPLVSVEPLLAEAERQSGRLAVEFDGALAALTGVDFDGDFERWAGWWKTTGRPALEDPEPEPEPRRRASTLGNRPGSQGKARARPRFFELDVHSHDVLFVLDISGSMDWPASFVGEPGGRRRPAHDPDAGPSRIEVAVEQLGGALTSLDEHARYNLIAFNDRARPWLERDGMADFGKAGKRTEDALEFLAELPPTDGTNLYGALEAAFEDPLVDTIYLLSDGVPSLGELRQPDLIRRSVLAWNDHREVVIHCVVMGLDEEQHPLARQLADDSGGSYVTVP